MSTDRPDPPATQHPTSRSHRIPDNQTVPDQHPRPRAHATPHPMLESITSTVRAAWRRLSAAGASGPGPDLRPVSPRRTGRPARRHWAYPRQPRRDTGLENNGLPTRKRITVAISVIMTTVVTTLAGTAGPAAAATCATRGLFQTTNGTGQLGTVTDTNGTTADYTGWSYWDTIVSGHFKAGNTADLLYYRSVDGQAVFYTAGTTSLVGTTSFHFQAAGNYWLGTGWTTVTAGNFDGAGGEDLMLYNRASGLTRFYSTTFSINTSTGVGTVRLARLGGDLNIGAGWDLTVPGDFGPGPAGGLTDLLMYSHNGTAKFLAPTGRGGLGTFREYTNWSKTWAQIVPGQFGGDAHTDLLFYDPFGGLLPYHAPSGRGLFNTVSGIADLSTLPNGDHRDWGTYWRKIVPGNFGSAPGESGPHTDLLFYGWPTTTSGYSRGLFQTTDGNGTLGDLSGGDHIDWGTWDLIVSAQFAGSTYSDLLFYDNGVCIR